jgi:hypothetical protein
MIILVWRFLDAFAGPFMCPNSPESAHNTPTSILQNYVGRPNHFQRSTAEGNLN